MRKVIAIFNLIKNNIFLYSYISYISPEIVSIMKASFGIVKALYHCSFLYPAIVPILVPYNAEELNAIMYIQYYGSY